MSEVEGLIDDVCTTQNIDEDAARSAIENLIIQIEETFPFKICQDCDTFVEQENHCTNCGGYNLECSFRDYQREILVEAAVKLWLEDYDNVVIEGPTGIGKSAINYVLGIVAESAFYTTPQKSLRNQLQSDDALQNGMHALRGRRDYTCGETGQDCQSCPVNQSQDASCKEQPNCTYWNEKELTMEEQIAVTTFAYLIVDDYLPTYSQDGDRVSFADRELLIVDECHTLEGQVASLFAGFTVSPWTVPPQVYGDAGTQLKRRFKSGEEINRHRDVEELLDNVAHRASQYARQHEGEEAKEDLVDDCESFLQKYEWFKAEVGEGRDWVVDVEDVDHPKAGQTKKMKLKPIKVDKFLQNFVWSRAKKRVLSTATMPYRGNPDEWFERLGLQGDTHVIRRPMPFPKENRPVHTETVIDKFSSGGDEENWDEIVAAVERLAREHDGQKGLIHTASYPRAQELVNSLPRGLAMTDEKGKDSDEVVEEWQNSECQILCSPSMMEGVDLKGDLCRWQVMLKVPYPNSHADSRVAFMLDERNDWDWYYQVTSLQLYQSIGRAVRSSDDWADYYVLDQSFMDVLNSTDAPNWVYEGLQAGE